MRNAILTGALALATLACSEPEPGNVVVGDDMPALAWEGYVNEAAEGVSTTHDYVDYDTNALRATGRRYALVHLSETF